MSCLLFHNLFKSMQQIVSGLFFARFQKTQGRLQKNSSRFLAKNSRLWRQLWISRKKTQYFLKKKPTEFFQKFYEVLFFMWIFQNFKQFLWNFPTKQRIFHLFLGNLKKTQGIFQKTQGSEKNSMLWRQCASGCLQKIGQKTALSHKYWKNKDQHSSKCAIDSWLMPGL